MVWDLIIGFLRGVGSFVVAPLGKGIHRKLHPTEREKALQAGIDGAQAREEKRPLQERLFYSDYYNLVGKFRIDGFLKEVLQPKEGEDKLQKLLYPKGIPDVPVLVDRFKEVAEKNPWIDLHEERIEPWLKAFKKVYVQNTNINSAFKAAKKNYCEQLERMCENVQFAGVAVEGQEKDKYALLTQIFVIPDVEEMQDRSSSWLAEESPEDSPPRRQQLLPNSSGRKLSAAQLLTPAQSRKIVLLGAPGAGKTTLISYFAMMLAQEKPADLGLAPGDWLPISIRMRDLAKDWTEGSHSSILDYVRQRAETTMQGKVLPEGFFENWLSDGRALILLDGLDEVVTNRHRVVEQISAFVGQFKENLVIITSRPAGYERGVFRTEEFTHYQLLSFDDRKIEAFIDKWYKNRVPDNEEAQRRKDSLKAALDVNDRIKLLARNPLLLTIIALIHRYQAELPKERYKLYDKAVETLLTSWDANKELSNHLKLEYLRLDDLRRLMESLAYWIHTQGSGGDKEGGTLIDRDELIDQLSKDIERVKQEKQHYWKEEAKRFVDFIQERTGLLNEQGTNSYGFVHKTFQEYLCAEDINYRCDVSACIKEHLHDPHWREVLLLLIAQQRPKEAATAIREILDRDSEYEQWLHRNLLFAGSCLAEDSKVEDKGLSQEILQKLVALEVSDEGKVGDRVKERVLETLCSLGGTKFEKQALHLLKDKAEDIGEWRWQEYQVALGEKDGVIEALVQRLDDEDSSVRRSAASALGYLGARDERVVEALVQCLDDEDSSVRSRAADALGKLGPRDERVVQALVQRLDDEDSDVRWRAVSALGKLGPRDEWVVEALVQRLEDEDSDVRGRAAFALGKLGPRDEWVVEALVQRLEDEDSDVRGSAAFALGNLGARDERVVEALVQLLEDEYSVRGRAACASGELGAGDERAAEALVQFLEYEYSYVRGSAASALGELGARDERVVGALVQSLDDEYFDVRWSAVSALGKLGARDERAVEALVQRLDDEDSSVRWRAAEALGNLGARDERVVEALVQLLHDEDSSVRWRAAEALGKLGARDERVVEALVQRLDDEVSDVRGRAAEALGNLGKNQPDVILPVEQWIEQHQDSEYVGYGIDALWNLVADAQ